MRSRALLLCVLLASCSGGGASSPAPRPTSATVATSTSKVTVTVKIPARAQSSARVPRYVSPSTKSMTVSVVPAGGGTPASATVDCSPSACTTTVDAPNGADTFTVNLYDATGGTGNLLSSGSTNYTIVAGQLNLVSITFGGVPAAIHLSVSPSGFARGVAATAQLTVTEVDADDNIIVGPPPAYPSPVTVSTSDTTGAVTLSTTQVTSASQPPITVTYNGSASAPGTVTFTSSASGVAPAKSGSASVTITTGTLLYASSEGGVDQFVVDHGVVQSLLGHFGDTGPGVQPSFSSVAVAPDETIYLQYAGDPLDAWGPDRLPKRMLPPQRGPLATDGAGNVYVATSKGIIVYPPTATGSTPPLRVMTVPALGIAIDPVGNVYADESTTRISVYAPNGSGAQGPVRSLLAASGVTFSNEMATDSAGNLYVAGALFNQPAILIYPLGAQGAVSPMRAINGPHTMLGAGVAVDGFGYVYAWGSTPSFLGIVTFAPGASGDATPISSFAAPHPRYLALAQLASDPNSITSAGPPQGAGRPPVVTFNQSRLQANTVVAPNRLAPGADGNVWFTYGQMDLVGKARPSGGVTTYPAPQGSAPHAITAGADGAMWFTEFATNMIGRVTTDGVITSYPVPVPCCSLYAITNGPDGNLWFTVYAAGGINAVGKMTTAGVATIYPISSNTQPGEITTGPDGNLWTSSATETLRVTTSGAFTVFPPTSTLARRTIAAGPDGNVWATTNSGLAKITPSTGAITPVPVNLPQTCCFEFTFGPDGFIYVDGISKVSLNGQVSYDVLTPGQIATGGSFTDFGITSGPDGNIWFLEHYPDGSAFGVNSVTQMVIH